MKIALCSSITPFTSDVGRDIVEGLEATLREAGHDVERIDLPHSDAPDTLVRQMASLRWVDLDAADRLICFRPPAHAIPHSKKVIWFIDPEASSFPDDVRHQGIREALDAADTAALKEAHAVFATSQVDADRLLDRNGARAEVLVPPAVGESWSRVIARLLA